MNKKLVSSLFSILSSMVCIITGILIGFIVLVIISPQGALQGITDLTVGYFTSSPHVLVKNLGNVVINATPLILTGLAVLFAYKAGLFNIGAAGQYCFSIMVTLAFAIGFKVNFIISCIMGILAGAFWGSLCGLLKVFFNVNEVISGIMLNWIALSITNMVLKTESFYNSIAAETKAVPNVAQIPQLGIPNSSMSIGIFISIAVSIVILIILDKTIFGFELKATGFNPHASKYAGMKEKRNVILTLAISGAIAGLSASLFYLNNVEHWKISSSVPSMGFDGICSAFLGGLNPIGNIFSAIFISHLKQNGGMLDTQYYPPQVANIVTGVIIYLSSFVMFISDYFFKRRNKRLEPYSNIINELLVRNTNSTKEYLTELSVINNDIENLKVSTPKNERNEGFKFKLNELKSKIKDIKKKYENQLSENKISYKKDLNSKKMEIKNSNNLEEAK